jgi:hypothetical protein
LSCDQSAAEEGGERHPEKADRVGPRRHPPAVLGRDELGQIGIDENQLRAQPDTGEDAQHEERLDVRREGGSE